MNRTGESGANYDVRFGKTRETWGLVENPTFDSAREKRQTLRITADKGGYAKLPRSGHLQSMSTWEPLTLQELQTYITEAESRMDPHHLAFWNKIKLPPSKWSEPDYGGTDGFWVVAVHGNRVIWYNDIEEGFNVSEFDRSGEIGEYGANQDELDLTVRNLSGSSATN